MQLLRGLDARTCRAMLVLGLATLLLMCLLAGDRCILPKVDAAAAPAGMVYSWNPGARCVDRDDPAAELTDICAGWIPHRSIYVDDLQHQRRLKVEERVTTITSITECVKWSYRVYCALMYRKCETVNVDGYGDVAVGEFLCNNMCTERYDSCYQQYLEFGVSPADTERTLSCTTPYAYDFGLPTADIFPASSNYTTNVVINNSTITFQGNVSLECYDDNQYLTGDFNKIYCPDGTYNDGPTKCALECPEPLISDNEYLAADIMLYIIGWFSFVATAFVVVSYLINARVKIRYPNSLPFFFVCCIMGVSFVFVLGSFVQQKNLRCTSERDPNTWGDGWCTVQGVTYVYFTLAGALWWLSIGLNMFVTIAFNYKPQELKLFNVGKYVVWQSQVIQGVLHVVCWGVPLIVTIIALSAHKIGYGPSDFWCTLHSGEEIRVELGDVFVELTGTGPVEEVDMWNLILLTIPIFTITLLGTLLLLLVFIFAWIKSRQGIKFLRHQWRLLGLMVLYLYVYSFVFGYRVQNTSDRHNQYDNYVSFINCLKSNIETDPNCELDTEVVYPVWFIAAFNVAGQGIFVFLIYGTSRGVAKAWGQLFQLCGIHVPCLGQEEISDGQSVIIPGTKIRSTATAMADEVSSEEEPTANESDEDDKDILTRIPAQAEESSSSGESDGDETETGQDMSEAIEMEPIAYNLT